jgi:hypothetical protein
MKKKISSLLEGVRPIRIYKYFSKYGTFYRPMEHGVSATGVSTYLGRDFYLDRIFFWGSGIREGGRWSVLNAKRSSGGL